MRKPACAARAAFLATGVMALAGCGSKSSNAQVPGVSLTAANESKAIAFNFSSLDERPVNSVALRGKPTILAFVATGNLGSQAQLNYLIQMASHDAAKTGEKAAATNYAMIALEPSAQRELVEIYRKVLKIQFPVAVADEASLGGEGPFGDLSIVPTVVVLDSEGRSRWRSQGRVVTTDELRTVLRDL